MAPVESKLDYTKARDIHSAGIVLLQMLLGRDVMERYDDPQVAIHMCESFPYNVQGRIKSKPRFSGNLYIPLDEGRGDVEPSQEGQRDVPKPPARSRLGTLPPRSQQPHPDDPVCRFERALV